MIHVCKQVYAMLDDDCMSASFYVDHVSCRESKITPQNMGFLSAAPFNGTCPMWLWMGISMFFFGSSGLIRLKKLLESLVQHVPFRGGAVRIRIPHFYSYSGWSLKLLLVLSKIHHSLTHSLCMPSACWNSIYMWSSTHAQNHEIVHSSA